MTLVSGSRGRSLPGHHKCSISLEWRPWITGCYIALQIWYGHWCMTLVPGPSYWEWNINSWRVGGQANKNQRVQVRKAPPIFACPQGRCHRHLRLRRAAWDHRRAAGIYYSPIPPTKPALRYQHLRASFLPRPFAAVDGRRASRGGVLAESFPKSATLALIIPRAADHD